MGDLGGGIAGCGVDGHIGADGAGEGIGAGTGIGDGLAGDFLQGGVGQADPALIALAPTVAVDGLDLVDIHGGALGQRAHDLAVGARAVTDVQIAVVGDGGSGNHIAGNGVGLGGSDLHPAAHGVHIAPAGAVCVQAVLGDLHIAADLDGLAVRVLELGGLDLSGNVNRGGGQLLDGQRILGILAGVAGHLPVGVQGLACAVGIQLGHPLAAGGIGVPAQELVAAVGGADMVGGGGGIVAHLVGAAVALGDLAAVGVIGHIGEIGGNGVGVLAVAVHVHFHLMAVVLLVIQALHDVQHLVDAGLAQDGGLQSAGAGHPGGAVAMAEHHQSVMLILGQRQLIVGSKAVDLLVQLGKICTQSGIGLLLGDGVLVLTGLRHTVGVEVMLLLTYRAVAHTVLGACHIVALLLESG